MPGQCCLAAKSMCGRHMHVQNACVCLTHTHVHMGCAGAGPACSDASVLPGGLGRHLPCAQLPAGAQQQRRLRPGTALAHCPIWPAARMGHAITSVASCRGCSMVGGHLDAWFQSYCDSCDGVRQVYVAEPGYMLSRSSVPKQAILTHLASVALPDLATLAQARSSSRHR